MSRRKILYNKTRTYTSLRCNTTLQKYFLDFLSLCFFVLLSFCLIGLIGSLISGLIGLIGGLIGLIGGLIGLIGCLIGLIGIRTPTIHDDMKIYRREIARI